MAYALVQDLPLSWEQYERTACHRVDPVPAGLIVHLAGPTDEGVRVIDIWDCEPSSHIADDARIQGAPAIPGEPPRPEPTIRGLHGFDLVLGPAATRGQWQQVEQRSKP